MGAALYRRGSEQQDMPWLVYMTPLGKTPSTLDLGPEGRDYGSYWALILGQGERISVFTDFKYALLVLPAHDAIWKERGLFSARNSPIKHRWEGVRLPKQVSVIHCRGYQRDMSPITKRNSKADQAARKAAQRPTAGLALFPSIDNATWSPITHLRRDLGL